MNILLTGGTGWIGKSLGVELVRRGHKIIGLSRDVKKAKRMAPYPATWLEWAVGESSLPAELDGRMPIDAVINLVGEPVAGGKRWTEAVKKEIELSRVQPTAQLAAFVMRHKIPVFVSASAIGYYGERGDEVLTEVSRVGQGFLAKVCEDWETSAFLAKSVARCVCLRIGIVLGRGGGALEKMVPLFQMGLGGPLGSATQWMSWIHYQDVERLLLECLENPKVQGVVNATAPQPVRQKEFATTLARVLKKPALLKTPEFVVKALFGELAQVVLSSQRVLPQVAQEQGFLFSFPHLAGALADLLAPESNKECVLEEQQFINRKLEEVFPFYASEKNLERLTPPFLHFLVLAKNTETLQEGTLIDYRLKLFGIPFYWRTQILHWQPPQQFVDQQLTGPYKLWHHTHRFEVLGSGTLITDRVRYQVPLGDLGAWVAGWKVKQMVKEIFSYRRTVLAEQIWPEA